MPILQCQLNDIINVCRDGVEVEGDTVASLCEVNTLVVAKDGGRLDFVVASRDEEAGVHTVKDVDVEFVTTLCTYIPSHVDQRCRHVYHRWFHHIGSAIYLRTEGG